MGVLIQIARSYCSCKVHRGEWEKTDVYKGLKLFISSRKSQQGLKDEVNCKGLITVYRELNELFRYWRCFPDTYFRFGMFVKGFGNMERMKSFVPQGAYYRYASDQDPRYHILLDDKILFHDVMRSYGLPVPERYFVFRNGTFIRNGCLISDNVVDEIIDRIEDERVFIKSFRGGAASGISVAMRKEGGLYTEDGRKLSSKVIREIYGNNNYIFEKQLQQDSALARLNPDTVNTCRVLTYKDKVVSCSIRVGRKGSYVDNAAKGGIVLSLNMETGKIEEYGLREYDLTKYYEHPDTKVIFKDYDVPMWPSVRELVEKTIRIMPYYRSVGFDVATTVNGPVIIEINTGTGVYASQMGKKQGIANMFK